MIECLPCEKALKKVGKLQELIQKAEQYARNDAAITGHKVYKIVRLVNGGVSWKRDDEPTELETIQYLSVD